MLKQETITRLAALAKIKADDLLNAIKGESENELVIDERLTVFSEDELTTLKNNEYKSGKDKGVEMSVKDAKEKHGFDFQGKTIEGLLEAAQKKALADAKVEPEKKVAELNEKISTLQNTVKKYEDDLTAKDNEVSSVKINGELYKHIPSLGDKGPALGADDVIQLMRSNGYDFKLENGKVVPYKDGKQVQDKVANPREAKDIINEFMKDKKLVSEVAVPAGRGGVDGKAVSRFGSLSELKKAFADQGKSMLGKEFSDEVAKAVQDNKEFIME